MSERSQTLDEALAALPRGVQPGRDLWPKIREEIDAESRLERRIPFLGRWGQLAAAVVLMIASSSLTYVLTRQSATSAVPSQQVVDMKNFSDALGPEYLRARADLERLFAERIASLPPATRARLQNNLAELRHAADEITATLAAHPADSLLQDLLLSTRQRELQLLADVSRMPIPNS